MSNISNIAKVYADLIKRGSKTIDEVPPIIIEEVRKIVVEEEILDEDIQGDA